MPRALVAVAALVTATALSGCGGASLDSIVRHDSEQTWGEPNPRILSVEHVQALSGSHETVVHLRGTFRFTCDAPGCHATTSHYAVLEISDQATGYSGSSRETEAALAAARNASPTFAIFPDFEFTVIRCTIPGGWGGSIDGTCATGSTPSGVVFEEHWPLSAPAGSRYRARWFVGLDSSEHVTSVRFTGNRPPQLWTTATQPSVPPRLVTRARHELAYLRIFPRFPGTKPCPFTGGGVRVQTFRGTCTTKLRSRRVVTFVERWGQSSGGWIVTVRHGDDSLSVRITGSNPPQSWR